MEARDPLLGVPIPLATSVSKQIHIVNKSLFDSIVGDLAVSVPVPKKPQRHRSKRLSAVERAKAAQKAKIRDRMAKIHEKVVVERAQADRRREEGHRRRRYEMESRIKELEEMIQEEQRTFLPQLKAFLDRHDLTTHEKKQRLYEEWNEKVFGKIQQELQSLVEDNFEDLRAARQKLYQEFLEMVNEKTQRGGSVYRDIVIENDYDPFSLPSLTVSIPPNDPTKRDARRAQEEAQTLAGGTVRRSTRGRKSANISGSSRRITSGRSASELQTDFPTPRAFEVDRPEEVIEGTRALLPVSQWSTLEATPYFDRLESVTKKTVPDVTQQASVVLDHFTVDPDAARREWGSHGKKMVPHAFAGRNPVIVDTGLPPIDGDD